MLYNEVWYIWLIDLFFLPVSGLYHQSFFVLPAFPYIAFRETPHTVACSPKAVAASFIARPATVSPAASPSPMTTETANRRMDFAMNIDYLNELKEKLSITNDQLAQMSGVPESTVSRILKGTTDNPNFQTIVDIVRTLKGSIDVMEDLCHTAESAPKETESESKKTAEKEEVQKARAEIFHAAIAVKNRWIRFLVGLLVCVLSFVLIMIAYDLLHPNKGWIQY